jgi:hypothetical protein
MFQTKRNWTFDYTSDVSRKEAQRVIAGRSEHFFFDHDLHNGDLTLRRRDGIIPEGKDARDVELALIDLLLPHTNQESPSSGVSIRTFEAFIHSRVQQG